MIQSLFKHQRRCPERPSVVENEQETRDQDSLTDCTLNNSLLLDIQMMNSTSSSSTRQAPESMMSMPKMAEAAALDDSELKASQHAGVSDYAKSGDGHRPSFSFSFSSKQFKSDSKSPCCGATSAETVASSNWSQVGVDGGTKSSGILENCLVCFWPALYTLNERHHSDCFVAVDCPSRMVEPSYWHGSYPDTPVFRTDSANTFTRIEEMDEQPATSFTPLTETILSLPKLPLSQVCQVNVEEANACQAMKLARLTPLTVHSKTSFTEYTNNVSTMNSLHRRTDDMSMGFFTAHTLDAIYSSPTKMNDDASTPRNQCCRLIIGGNTRSAFQTPSNRARVDSETFRRTMTVVTCEKRRIADADDSDVSPIGSDLGISPMLESRNNRAAVESLPRRQSTNTSTHKRLMFDIGSVRRYDTPNIPRPPPSGARGRNLFQDETMSQHLSPLSELGMSVMKSLHSIVQGRTPSSSNIPSYVETKGWAEDKENMPGNIPANLSSSITESEQRLWTDAFLQKSSSFLKALRKTGRRGKVLIQGWIAFREDTVPWKEIMRSPKRCDFRYIILLDDMPLLYMFSSRLKQKKLMPKHDLLRDCISLDLTGEDIAARVNLVSKEFGNEVCILDEETGRNYYSLLPIPMPQNVFLDKHQSRLAKGEALESVFGPFKRNVTFASSHGMIEKPTATIDHPATMEQYDVSRFLLFTIDAAIKFPLPRGAVNSQERPYQ